METFDGRKLDHKTLEQLRIRAVQRVLDGESPESVIKALGFTKPRIYEWLSKFREGGWDALKAKVIPGRPRKGDWIPDGLALPHGRGHQSSFAASFSLRAVDAGHGT